MEAQNGNLRKGISDGDVYDCLILGGGPAGLSAATVLARHAMRTIIFDCDTDRYSKNIVSAWDRSETWRLLKRNLSSGQVAGIVTCEATAITKIEQVVHGHFTVADSTSSTWRGRRIILATGVRELLPDIPGFDECWDQGIYPAGVTHRLPRVTEDAAERVKSVGILALNELATVERVTTLALLAHRTADTVTIYTDGDNEMAHGLLEHQSLATSSSLGRVLVDSRLLLQISRHESHESNTKEVIEIQLVDNSSSFHDFLVHEPKTQPNAAFVHQLGLDLTEKGDISVSPVSRATNVPGVFAVGDCASSIKTVIHAVSLGALGGEAVSVDLAGTPWATLGDHAMH